MTDLFDEVESDLRRERLARFWERFGVYVILVAVLIVAVTAGWRGYEWYRVDRERSAGDAYVAVLDEAEEAGTASSAEALTQFAQDAPSGFAMLAEFRAATTFAQAGEPDRAIEILRGLTDNSDVTALYRDLARVRLAQFLITAGDLAGAQDAVRALAEDAGNPFFRSAQEMMGLAAFTDNDLEAAQRWYGSVANEVGTSTAMRQRAEEMLGLIARVVPLAAAPAVDSAADPAPAADEASASGAALDGDAADTGVTAGAETPVETAPAATPAAADAAPAVAPTAADTADAEETN